MFSCLFWAGVDVFVGVAAAQGLTAEDAVRAALLHDPTHIAAVAAADSAEAGRTASLGLRHNPTVDAQRSLTSPRFGVAVAQEVSLTGEGLARAAEARAVADSAALLRRRAALVAAAAARIAWIDVATAEAQLRLADQALADAHTRRVAIEARVAAGDAAPLDARLARLAEADATLAVLDARRARDAARVALVALVPDAADREIEGRPSDAVPMALGTGRREDVDAADQEVAAAEASVRAASAAILPAVVVGAFVESEEDTVSAGPTLSLTLPLWQQNADGRAEAGAALARAKAEAGATRRRAEVERETSRATADAAEAARRALATSPEADAAAARQAIDDAETAGDLDVATATVLRHEVWDGAQAALTLERVAAQSALDALLAAGDPALLPPDLREVSR